eukprot:8597662-Pyramimonas_sp.AAC.1
MPRDVNCWFPAGYVVRPPDGTIRPTPTVVQVGCPYHAPPRHRGGGGQLGPRTIRDLRGGLSRMLVQWAVATVGSDHQGS